MKLILVKSNSETNASTVLQIQQNNKIIRKWGFSSSLIFYL